MSGRRVAMAVGAGMAGAAIGGLIGLLSRLDVTNQASLSAEGGLLFGGTTIVLLVIRRDDGLRTALREAKLLHDEGLIDPTEYAARKAACLAAYRP